MTTPHAVTVLVVDDSRPFRVAAGGVLRRAGGFTVVGEAQSGEAAVEQCRALHPDLVLMDVQMPGIGGVEAARRIAAERPATVVVLCSTYSRDDLPADVATSGAAYLCKEELAPGLLRRLWLAAATAGTAAPAG